MGHRVIKTVVPDWTKGAWQNPEKFFKALGPTNIKVLGAAIMILFLFPMTKAYLSGEGWPEASDPPFSFSEFYGSLSGMIGALMILRTGISQRIIRTMTTAALKILPFTRWVKKGGWIGFAASVVVEYFVFMFLSAVLGEQATAQIKRMQEMDARRFRRNLYNAGFEAMNAPDANLAAKVGGATLVAAGALHEMFDFGEGGALQTSIRAGGDIQACLLYTSDAADE